jgi:LytS/YehU family sensor histidine kinase
MTFPIAVLPGLLGFYSCYTLLFHRYLASRKIVKLLLATLLSCLLAAVVSELFLYFVFRRRLSFTTETVISLGIVIAGIALLNGAIGLGMRSFITWYRDLKWKEALSRKNHEMEMALVKAQLNPHFLFNTINNIDILITKDPERASAYLNRLSGILRFALYETQAERIPLQKEITYIEEYIALQQIRSSNPDFIQYSLSGDAGALRIAPMLLIPFLENAFKHTVARKQGPAVQVGISIQEQQLFFVCTNAYLPGHNAGVEYGGLGNELIRKRLELLYPGSHELKITDQEGVYQVNLSLNLA